MPRTAWRTICRKKLPEAIRRSLYLPCSSKNPALCRVFCGLAFDREEIGALTERDDPAGRLVLMIRPAIGGVCMTFPQKNGTGYGADGRRLAWTTGTIGVS